MFGLRERRRVGALPELPLLFEDAGSAIRKRGKNCFTPLVLYEQIVACLVRFQWKRQHCDGSSKKMLELVDKIETILSLHEVAHADVTRKIQFVPIVCSMDSSIARWRLVLTYSSHRATGPWPSGHGPPPPHMANSRN